MLVEILDALGGNADLDVVDVVFRAAGTRRRFFNPRRVDQDIVGRIILAGIDDVVGRHWRLVWAWLVDLDRVAIEIRVRKECGRLPEIHDREEKLSVVLVDTGAATDDLLKLGHGFDAPVEDDEVAGLGVDAGAHETGGRADDGIGGFRVDEVVELSLALVVVTGDAHDVFGVGGGEVGVGVGHGLAHALGVVDVLAEDDGLGEAVGGPEKLGDLGGDGRGALFQDEVLVVVSDVVFAVLDELAVFVGLAGFGPPAVEVFVEADADDLVGGEEAVGDALAKGIRVDGVTEVFDVGSLLGLLRRGGEADLRRGGEVFENFAPRE